MCLLTERELLVIRTKETQQQILKSCHAGDGSSDEARSLGGHFGIIRTQEKILQR